MIIADKAFLSEIDKKAEALKAEIYAAKDSLEYSGKAYYVSQINGNDMNDGLTPQTAVKSLDRIATLPIDSGDAILLERGCEWRGNGVVIKKDGITLGAYGEGAKPVINISLKNYANPDEWVKTDAENIWKYKYPFGIDVGHIVCDESIHCIKKCKGHYGFGDDYHELSKDLEFYCDRFNENYLYFYSEQNPGERFRLMDAQRIVCGIRVTAKKDIRVDNICVKNAFFGISTGNIENFHVSNCEFGVIGGSGRFSKPDAPSMTRLGNGVEMYGICDNFVVENCYFHDIYDAGVTHQRSMHSPHNFPVIMSNVRYENNLFERCIYSIEYFCGQNNPDFDAKMVNILMKGNICRYAGGFGWQRPNRVARHIQGGWLGNRIPCYKSENFVIENNIFDRSIDVLVSCGPLEEAWLPEMKNNTYVQYAGKNYGGNFVPYDHYKPFDENIEKFIKEDRGEADAVVAIVPEYDGMCD